MSRNLNAKQPAKNIGAKPPTRRIDRGDGVMVTEKVSPIPFSRKMVAPDGDVVFVSLANGFTIRGFKGNDYGRQIWEEKLKAGFLPFDECPFTGESFKKHYVKAGKDDAPCKGQNGVGGFSNEECCPHLNKIIASRKDEHRRAQLEYGSNFATQQDRMIALLEKQTARLAQPEVAVSGKGRVPGG